MQLDQYLDTNVLGNHLRDGLVDVRYHHSLPLRILTFSKRTVYENAWDEVTTKCRGLIVGPGNVIVSRPFEKFFNLETSFRPETWIKNLPSTLPIVTEKLDGSLGILYRHRVPSPSVMDPAALRDYVEVHGIATKGSFHSEQAKWATLWYNRVCVNPQWPVGFTPVFEIIAESVQHHVVHYGTEELVLLGLINNETGEEADYNTVYQYAYLNGLKAVDIHAKTVAATLYEDRKNREGYVLSWPQPGKPPLKVKVKHPGFLNLQKIVHAATPKAILEALTAANVNLLDTWIGQTNDPIGVWVKGWMMRFNFKYMEILLKSNEAYKKGSMLAAVAPEGEGRKTFAKFVLKEFPEVARIAFTMLDGKEIQPAIWKLVEQRFADELTKPFALEAA